MCENWQTPIRRMPFEASGFIPSSNLAALQRKYWRQLDKADALRADAAQVCECGAANILADHTADCWARPLPVMPFEVAGFTISKPLPYKIVDAPASRWFDSCSAMVLPLTNSLFKARATRKEMYA